MSDDKQGNTHIWDIENTHPNLVPALEDGLCEIMDPELGLNIVQLGLVRNVEMEEGQAAVTMILTTPFCPYGPSMIERTRKKTETILEVPTTIRYGREAWDPTMMEEGLGDDWGLY
ncbi:MAG: iron-sulfur cluster assembly protein [Chloroflexota bacterium]|nr:iron-sulfur cluster assembly protein [Chloroflexota bacterium]